MVKIFLSVRNRLAITKKCIEALVKNSSLEHQIYVYDNLTNYRLQHHAIYWADMLEKGIVAQVTFNTAKSTFNAFSKVAASNQFGRLHQEDPNKNKYDFLMFIDNDVIVKPNWDGILRETWDWFEYSCAPLFHIKVVSQKSGGFVQLYEHVHQIAGYDAYIGTNGASGFWSVRPDFFDDVGFIDLKNVIGKVKGHDRYYWDLLRESAGVSHYGLVIDAPLAFHIGGIFKSICDMLHHGDGNRLENIKFEEDEKKVESMTLDELFEKYSKHPLCLKW